MESIAATLHDDGVVERVDPAHGEGVVGGADRRADRLGEERDDVGRVLSVELDRVIPAIQAVRAISSIPISIDTTKGEVARAALEAGANMINDVSAGQRDPAMLSLAASKHVPVRVFNVLCTDSE